MVRFLSMTVALASATTIFASVGTSAPVAYPTPMLAPALAPVPAIGSTDRPFVLSKVTVRATPLP